MNPSRKRPLKKSSCVLYTIGFVFNVILFLCALGTFIAVSIASADQIQAFMSAHNSNLSNPAVFRSRVIGLATLLVIFYIVTLVIGIKGRKNVENNVPHQYGFHITALILGTIGANFFYTVAGILGLFVENK